MCHAFLLKILYRNIFICSSMYYSKAVKLFERQISASHRTIASLNLWNEELTSEIKHKIENYWSQHIPTANFKVNDSSREKYYVLSMFPYPSGQLHMGHVRVYTISDSVARFQRMNGKNVIHPIGWDAFGLPAENAAIDRNVAPDKWTNDNIACMKKQLQQLGCSFEWHREIATCNSNYYKWTQSLFLKLLESGLAYQKQASVNWDPIDKTVLADEQVDENGCSWRSGAKIEKRFLKQWFVRTTYFAKDLFISLDDPELQDWRDIIKLQKHWIGLCDGVRFEFQIKNSQGSKEDYLSLWTGKPEFIADAKFIAVSTEHTLAKCDGDIIDNTTKKLCCLARNPINGQDLPIFVTNCIEYLPQTDSYIGIPGVFDQDRNFAHKFNIQFTLIDTELSDEQVTEKQQNVCEKAKNLGVGGYWTSSKLKDWLISRQRYWGTPIPIVHCQKCGAQPVPNQELPVVLPNLSKLSKKGGCQLGENLEWLKTQCPKCKGSAVRETDTMDTFVDSSWYYLRYLDPNNDQEMFNVEKVRHMAPVDLYIGGKEHAVLHMYYARFISHFLYSLGLVPHKEPFKRLLVQGMVMGRSYRLKGTGKYVLADQVTVIDPKKNKAVHKITGDQVVMSWEKMSKSKHNGVDPSEMFDQYGVDTTRLLIMADVAPTSHRNWNSNTFPGVLNWQRRLWLTIRDFIEHRNNLPKMIPEDQFKTHEDYMFDSRNYYVKGTTFNYYLSQQMSVAVSKMQGLTNSLRKVPPAVFAHGLQFERALASQIILLAPMAPHFASELWSGFVSAPNHLISDNEIQRHKTVLEQKWPEIDFDYNLELICQVNGWESAVIKIPRKEIEKLSKDDAINLVLKQQNIQDVLAHRTILDIKYSLYPGYENVVNILTARPPAKQAKEEVICANK